MDLKLHDIIIKSLYIKVCFSFWLLLLLLLLLFLLYMSKSGIQNIQKCLLKENTLCDESTNIVSSLHELNGMDA